MQCTRLPHEMGVELLSRRECQRVIRATERAAEPSDYRGNRRAQWHDDSGQLCARLWQRVQPHLPAILNVDWLPGEDQGDYPKRGRWQAVGLNPRFRFSKYFPGERFQLHADALAWLQPDYCSFLTLNIYLNDLQAAHDAVPRARTTHQNSSSQAGDQQLKGKSSTLGSAADMDTHAHAATLPRGLTHFYLSRNKGEAPVASGGGNAGSAVVFKQEQALHAGEALGTGLKYLMRTDVMFKYLGPPSSSVVVLAL